MNTIQEYVVGLAFSMDNEDIALIKKKRPAWQRGKYNGIGGKVERNESPGEMRGEKMLDDLSVEQRKRFAETVGVK
jgi:8-oxo-dGTP diphosphatase